MIFPAMTGLRWRVTAAAASLAAVAVLVSGLELATAMPGQVQGSALRLAPMFGDHGVLQRDRPISVWGDAPPGMRVTVSLEDLHAQVRADATGRWRALLPARPAGGPFTLSARSEDGETQTLRDIMVGDVFLCSGQSNMEHPVRYAQRAWDPVAAPEDVAIRLMTIGKDSDLRPLDALRHPAAWVPATPETVESFSAACFFFAQDLRRDHPVPLGLIANPWGGSAIEAWISAERLASLGNHGPQLAILGRFADDPAAGAALWGEQWQSWWTSRHTDRPWTDPVGTWTPVPALTPWESWGEAGLAGFDGMVWYRLELDLTASQAEDLATGASLSLGVIDEANTTWVNGRAVGAGGAGDTTYPLPVGLLRAGRNQIVSNVYDSWGPGGFWGPGSAQTLRAESGVTVPLNPAHWRYRRDEDESQRPPRAPWEPLFGLGTIGNAMISPLHDYGLRAVLWYQGESNVDLAAVRYQALLSALMTDWRVRLSQPDLPFLIVQLANYGAAPTTPQPSGWSEVREGQRLAVANDARAAMVVAIDLGDPRDIHPGQKREVGRRLADAARRLVYGQDDTGAGPAPVSARWQGDAVVVQFIHSAPLTTVSSDHVVGLELCDAAEVACRYVAGSVAGDAVHLPLREDGHTVRFCWGDSPICNLFDAAGRPAAPFRLEIERRR